MFAASGGPGPSVVPSFLIYVLLQANCNGKYKVFIFIYHEEIACCAFNLLLRGMKAYESLRHPSSGKQV